MGADPPTSTAPSTSTSTRPGSARAVAIADHIIKTGDASDYLRFLSTGGSDYPLNELRIAGVDLEKPETVQSAMKVFDETVSELEALLK